MFLVSDDGHFIAYEPEIQNRYTVSILSMKDIRLRMIEMGFTPDIFPSIDVKKIVALKDH